MTFAELGITSGTSLPLRPIPKETFFLWCGSGDNGGTGDGIRDLPMLGRNLTDSSCKMFLLLRSGGDGGGGIDVKVMAVAVVVAVEPQTR